MTLKNRANIRTIMGSKSLENQEKLKAKNVSQEKLRKLKEAKHQKVGRKDEIKTLSLIGK